MRLGLRQPTAEVASRLLVFLARLLELHLELASRLYETLIFAVPKNNDFL